MAAIVYVDADAPEGGDGQSWATALRSIQQGVDQAAPLGAEVWVAGGLYQQKVDLHTGVSLYGGFAGTETALDQRRLGISPAVIDVSTTESGSPARYGIQLNDVREVRVDGFTIQGAHNTLGNRENGRGGIYCIGINNTNTIANCVVQDNISHDVGGGIFCYMASPIITNCTLTRNTADNLAGGYGGGIAIFWSSPRITNCVIHGNLQDGIGMETGSPTIAHCTIVGNSKFAITCIRSQPTIINCIVANNGVGGIREYDALSHPVTRNCLFFSNSDRDYYHWDTQQYLAGAHAINLTVPGASGNLDGDPLFVDASGGDYHLADGSAALDGGDPTAGVVDDIDGEPRPGSDGFYDIGADEAPPEFTPPGDDDLPESTVVDLPPAVTTMQFNVPYLASDPSSPIQFVQLYYRRGGGNWSLYPGEFTVNPIVFDAGTTGGDGQYDFYTLATDTADNVEEPPSAADASTVLVSTFSGTRVHVKADSPGDPTGTDWGNALPGINAGLIVAGAFAVSEVWVAEGTFEEKVGMLSGVALYGGFAGTETVRSQRQLAEHPTVIDVSRADGGNPSRYAVLFEETESARLDGFTVQGAHNIFGNRENGRGGIYCFGIDNTNTIASCVVQDNISHDIGGGIFCYGSSPLITSCFITRNSADNVGGGYGGGIALFLSSSRIENCFICGNLQDGIAMEASSPSIFYCTIHGNTNYGVHCQRYSPLLLNSILSSNGNGGVYEADTDSTPTTRRCLFHNNGGWDYYYAGTGQYLVGADAINQTVPGASANIDGDPLFADPENGDFHLLVGSPCIDQAETVAGINRDYEGDPRPYGPAPDIGADECLGVSATPLLMVH